MLDQQGQGWDFTDKFVCADCVTEPTLQALIAADASVDQSCDFCGGDIACELDVLLAAFVRGVRREYGRADDEGVFYDGREGGYQWTTWDTSELVDIFEYVFANDALREAVVEAMHE